MCAGLYHLSNQRHRRRGSNTSVCSTGQGMPTARLLSRFASRYSSVTISATISPVSDVRGPETALKPSRRDPSSEKISSRTRCPGSGTRGRSEEHTSELQSRQYLVCRLLLEKKKNT